MDTSLELPSGMTYAIGSFSVREDSTPVNAGDNTGGTGSIGLSFADFPDASMLVLKDIILRDRFFGKIGGRITGVGGDDFEASMSADSRLIALVDEVTAEPYIGTLGGAIQYYLNLAGIPDDPEIDPTLAAKPVAYIGWNGLLYDKLKELTILHRMEISLVSNVITVRPIRGRIAESANMAEFSWSVDAGGLYSSFNVANYNLREVTEELVYPVAVGEGTVITMEPNEKITTTISTNTSLTSIEQPQITQDFPEYYDGTLSLYAVTDSNGLPISSAEWTQLGGYLRAEIDPDDASKIIITARGGSDQERGPYKLAMPRSLENRSAGEYPALAVVGSGVAFNREVYEVGTGVPNALSQGRQGPTIDTIFAANRGDAWQLAASAAISYSSPERIISAEVEYANRLGEDGVYTGASYDDFEDEYPTESYTQFNTEKGTETYEEFAEDYLGRVVENFDNQAFGNTAGSRVRFGDMYVRIRSANITHEGISYDAEEDTTIEEFQSVWNGLEDYSDFEAEWAEATYVDFGAAPLRRQEPTELPPPPDTGVAYPASDLFPAADLFTTGA